MKAEVYGVVLVVVLAVACSGSANGILPQQTRQFLRAHCLDCHNADTQEGEIRLDQSPTGWDSATVARWQRVLRVLKSGEMPPADHDQPTVADRGKMITWIDQQLTKHVAIGGTLPRRLNRAEYQATVERLFGLKKFALPAGFPADREHHGFDNLGAGLVLSPPLLESYQETARLIADQIFPPQRPTPKRSSRVAAAKDLVISYSSGKRVDGALRLGMKCDPIQRSCTWPSRIEARVSGVYDLTVDLSTFRPATNQPMIAKVFARDVASPDGVRHNTLRLLKELRVSSESPQSFQFPVELYKGQTVVLHWANATLDSDGPDKQQLLKYFQDRDKQVPGYLAAWHNMVTASSGQGFRGGIGWERVKTRLAKPDVAKISAAEKADLLKKIARNTVLYAETVVFDAFENGPALEIHQVKLDGPLRVIEGPEERAQKQLQATFMGDRESPQQVIERFLNLAFRQPVDAKTLATYQAIYDRQIAAGSSPHDAMHLLIRSVLISPRFLYRSLTNGPLDDHDLATRLSYFLTGSSPDSRLRAKADAGQLTAKGGLRREAERLMPKNPKSLLVRNFTGQWLDTRKLADIMPDKRFKFSPKDKNVARDEVEYFFAEMIRENRPLTDFIDPDFTWTSARLARNIYQLKRGYDRQKGNSIQRITLPRGGRFGGILGQSAVMMATANGVDTQPVLRGVWVLENVLGTPPPPPPKAVPPITPDTTGAKTPRDLLAAHTSQASCARCHRKIDPVGLVLENFDPVGRWREQWPKIKQPIDSQAVLPDGTKIRDAVEFKAWLVKNIDQFSECLAEKLLTYATGRVPNYVERKEIARIVKANHASGNGFRDLLLALIESETFRTK